MIALVLGFFSSPGRIAGAGVLALFLAFAGYQEVRIVAKDHSLSVAAAHSAGLDKTIGQLKQSLSSDDAALTQYAKLAVDAKAAQEAADARAKAAADTAAKALSALKATPVPKDCKGAAKWAATTARTLAKGWQ